MKEVKAMNLCTKKMNYLLKTVLIYTFLFALTFALTYIYIFIQKKSLIWEGDGWQNIEFNYWYSTYVRQIIKNFMNF